jgi:hypothetical protein
MELTSVAIRQYALFLVGKAVLAMMEIKTSPPTVTAEMEASYTDV